MSSQNGSTSTAGSLHVKNEKGQLILHLQDMQVRAPPASKNECTEEWVKAELGQSHIKEAVFQRKRAKPEAYNCRSSLEELTVNIIQ
jgi:hypothetical protein